MKNILFSFTITFSFLFAPVISYAGPCTWAWNNFQSNIDSTLSTSLEACSFDVNCEDAAIAVHIEHSVYNNVAWTLCCINTPLLC